MSILGMGNKLEEFYNRNGEVDKAEAQRISNLNYARSKCVRCHKYISTHWFKTPTKYKVEFYTPSSKDLTAIVLKKTDNGYQELFHATSDKIYHSGWFFSTPLKEKSSKDKEDFISEIITGRRKIYNITNSEIYF